MLSLVEKLESKAFSFIRIGPLLLLLSVAFVSSRYAVARTPVKRSHQEIGVNERRQTEQRLWELGYWAGPIDGKFDSASRQALVAFQKVEGRARTGKLTSTELSALLTASRPRPRFEGYGHIEIDLTRQVLFVINENGTIIRILPVSSGNEGRYVDHGQIHRAHTPRGTFKVLRKINGWRLSSLGLLYYPSYILNGLAIHGSLSVPTYPASHGCIRVPMFAAKELSALMPIGIEVSIYS
ncbi:MAG TPA: L,D-transpeptidase family protein [Pyrinomonadaceae bacterium]|nr:L,D-transpeptidase family protein [Pyrinomonadaceae bacterium]